MSANPQATIAVTRQGVKPGSIAGMYLKKGCIVPKHFHENEQLTYVLDGALAFLAGRRPEG